MEYHSRRQWDTTTSGHSVYSDPVGASRKRYRRGDEATHMDGLNGRYVWDEEADPSDAEFLRGGSGVDYLPDGQTAITYLSIYDNEAEVIGSVGVYVSDLPNGLDSVYRVEVEDGRIVDLEFGQEVYEEYVSAQDKGRDG